MHFEEDVPTVILLPKDCEFVRTDNCTFGCTYMCAVLPSMSKVVSLLQAVILDILVDNRFKTMENIMLFNPSTRFILINSGL